MHNFSKKFTKKLFQIVLICFFTLTFLLNPMFNLVKNLNIDKEYSDTGKVLINKLDIKNANIAANSKGPLDLLLAFHSNNRYFGQTGDYQDNKSLIELLRQNNIDYYFVWEDVSNNKELSSYLPEISQDLIPGLKVYSLKKVN